MVQMITTLIGLVAGAVGYLIVTFWFRPILRYKEIRSRVISDIVFFANAVSLKGANNNPSRNAYGNGSRQIADIPQILRQFMGSYPIYTFVISNGKAYPLMVQCQS